MEKIMTFHEFYEKIRELGLRFLIYRNSQRYGGMKVMSPMVIRIIRDRDIGKYEIPKVSLMIIAEPVKPVDMERLTEDGPKFIDHLNEIEELPAEGMKYTYLLIEDGDISPIYLCENSFSDVYKRIEASENG